jgi:small subunit ribosomal protein S18
VSDFRQRRGRRFAPRRKVCYFCSEKSSGIDYKEVDLLRRFVSDRGKIRPRRQTGVCAKHQRQLTVAIKRARHMVLLPFVAELHK